MTTRNRSLLFHIADVLLNIVIIVAIVVGIRFFLVSPFQVEGSSMEDTLEHKQYIIINKLAYHIGSPLRGDVVVFRPPTDERKHYVKRVIGIPGDTVILRGGEVYVKRQDAAEEAKLQEAYLSERNSGHTYQNPGSRGTVTYEVPDGQYFLLGDNRLGSLDSRHFGGENGLSQAYVPEENIKGRVWFIALPITKIHALEPPEYGL